MALVLTKIYSFVAQNGKKVQKSNSSNFSVFGVVTELSVNSEVSNKGSLAPTQPMELNVRQSVTISKNSS